MPRRHFELPLNFNGPAVNTRSRTAARRQSPPFFSPVNHSLFDPPTMEGDHDPPPPAAAAHSDNLPPPANFHGRSTERGEDFF
jgi:hypothetical protein